MNVPKPDIQNAKKRIINSENIKMIVPEDIENVRSGEWSTQGTHNTANTTQGQTNMKSKEEHNSEDQPGVNTDGVAITNVNTADFDTASIRTVISKNVAEQKDKFGTKNVHGQFISQQLRKSKSNKITAKDVDNPEYKKEDTSSSQNDPQTPIATVTNKTNPSTKLNVVSFHPEEKHSKLISFKETNNIAPPIVFADQQ